MKYKNFVLVAACLVCAVPLLGAQKQQKSSVKKQQKKSSKGAQQIKSRKEFKEALDNNEIVVAEFYSPACPHCKQMAPIIEEFATANPDVAVIAISAFEDDNKSLFDEYNVSGYPMIVFVKNGKTDSKLMGKSPRQILDKKLSELKNK